jgi:hypothetical protein
MAEEARQGTMNGGAAKPTLEQANSMARQMVLTQAQNMVQSVYTTTVSNGGTISTSNNTLSFNPRMVGLLKRFVVEVTATVTNTGSVTALTRSKLGPANVLSNVQLSDLSNNLRHNTSGAHLHLLSTAKRNKPFGSAVVATTGMDSPVAFGNVTGIMSAPASIAAGATGTVNWCYEIPVTYSDNDLRGAIWLGVTGQTMNVQLSLNPQFVVASGDATFAGYSGNTGTLSGVTINVYQHYLDQLPYGKTGPVLPVVDMSTLYMLNQTTNTAIVQAQDYPIPYANFRDFLSTIAVVDNGGTLYPSTDVNYVSLTAANFTNFFKIDPTLISLRSRSHIGCDFPAGVHYFDHRHRPVSTNQYGNMELIFNLGNGTQALASGSSIFTMYEMFAMVNLIGQAGSLNLG